MNRTSKMDLHGARTATDIERKYNFGKSFAEVMGIATDAQNLARQAAESGANLTQEEVFNILTNNGQAQGIFRGDNGEVYINAEYIVSLASMFAKDIVMTGTFTCETEYYVPPSREEIEIIDAHIRGDITIPDDLIPMYDFDGDGQVTQFDSQTAQMMAMGYTPPDGFPAAKPTRVTMKIDMSDPERAIQFSGTNMWGRQFNGYVGASFTTAKNPETEARITALEERIKALEMQGG